MCRKVDAMWENETVVLVTTLKKRLLGNGERLRFSRIVSDDAVPPFIKQIFEDRIRKYVADEKPLRISETPHFEVTTKSKEKLQGQIGDVLRGAAVFPPEEVEDVLKEALVLRLDFLLKPIDTMRRLLFDGGDTVSVAEMATRLDGFRKILPYTDILIGQFKESGKTAVHQEEYGATANHSMQDLIEKEPVQVIMRDFTILTDFLSETQGEEVGRIEGALLKDFLADRNAWGFRRAVDVEMKLGREDFSAADLELTLKRYIELRDEFSESEAKEEPMHAVSGVEPAAVDVKDEPVAETDAAATADKATDAGAEAEDWHLEEALAEEELFIEEEKKTGAVEETPAVESEAATEIESIEEEPDQPAVEKPKQMKIIRKEKKEKKEKAKEEKEAEKKEDDVIEPPVTPPKRVSGFKDLIDDKTEKTFVKKLFGGDRDVYDELLGRLEEAESWRVAKILIDNELFKRDVDPFSREAIKLVDLVYSLYYPEEGVGGT